ncbi:MAG: hypothetical protein ACRERE_08205 [Candidatus Entotheonellia bacterium]
MRPLQAHCHRGLGTLYAKTGRPEQARAALATAIEALPRHEDDVLAAPGRGYAGANRRTGPLRERRVVRWSAQI